MASINYDSFWDDVSRGNVDVDTDTFKIMLVTSSYAANKGTHTRRSDVTNEVSGTGYTAGGKTIAITVAKDTGLHKETFTPAATSWASSSIAAAGAVIYKSRGGASSADELVAFIDFGATKTSDGGSFDVTFSSPITLQN
jgi:hypothetical protein